jgi:hypothetical protein
MSARTLLQTLRSQIGTQEKVLVRPANMPGMWGTSDIIEGYQCGVRTAALALAFPTLLRHGTRRSAML